MHIPQNPKPKNTILEKNPQTRKTKQKQINKNLEKINTINKKHGKIKNRCTLKQKKNKTKTFTK